MSNRITEILCVILWGFALIVFLSLITFHISDYEALGNLPVQNMLGPLGVLLAQLLRISFGIASYFTVAILILTGWGLVKYKSIEPVLEHIFAITFSMVTASLLITIISPETIAPFAGGVVGMALYHVLISIMGITGAWIATVVLSLISLILLGIVSISYILEGNRFNSLAKVATMLYTKLVLLKNKDSIPLIDIKSFNAEKKIPWITKTKITLYNKTQLKKPKLIEYDNVLRHKSDSSYYNEDDCLNDLQIITTSPLPTTSVAVQNCCPSNVATTDVDIQKEAAPQFAKSSAVIELQPIGNEPYEQKTTTVDTEIQDKNETIEEEYEYSEDTAENEEDMVARNVFEEIPINQKYSIPVDFLKQHTAVDETGYKQEIAKNSELLVNTLRDFGIESKVINVNRGPVITLYELQIAPGIKVNRIVSLADDIAMSLAASRVRVVAPIPGKKAIGVEIPNKVRETVTLKDIISSSEYAHQQGRLKVGLGKDIMGKPVIIDLKKLPHLLIAGATGAGKSVCVHSIITSLVYNYDPNYVRFIMVDPKLVELQIYNGIPHLLTPVIIEPFMVPKALKWTMMEMERRYYLLSEYNTRDIDRYNQMVERNKTGEYLPYIVIIMDELADLMMVAAKEIEGYITRIAQKARAVGIHLVLATQRPSVDIITGIIKANFPARIAFQVAQKTDSRTIIDQNGAEKLLGKGDMLYQSPMSSFPIRIQGAFISEDELSSIVAYLKKIAKPHYVDIEQSLVEFDEDEEEGEDELFIEAVKIVETTKKASASYLQRRLSIGYNRAARIIERMEELGYIGPQQGSKPRDVYI
ncbi:MAG: DNA translocase FtsK [Spirochaetes bacterium]|nr:DNA translocase FtsK [Spirochaetota bacterium]